MTKKVKNVAASVHARLLQKAKAEGRSFNELLPYLNARLALQVDVGFGDIVTPGPIELTYPTLLGTERPRLLGYPLETMLAEKLHAMVVLDMANTRMKDFLDLWTIAMRHELSGKLVAQAVAATFERRATPTPGSPPIALTEAFYKSPVKQAQWVAYLRKAHVSSAPTELEEVMRKLQTLTRPILDSLSARMPFVAQWAPGGPWSVSPRVPLGDKGRTRGR